MRENEKVFYNTVILALRSSKTIFQLFQKIILSETFHINITLLYNTVISCIYTYTVKKTAFQINQKTAFHAFSFQMSPDYTLQFYMKK